MMWVHFTVGGRHRKQIFFAGNRLATVVWLLDQGVDVNVVNRYGNNALHWAVKGGYHEVSALPLEHDANPDQLDYPGWTPRRIAHLSDDHEIKKLIAD